MLMNPAGGAEPYKEFLDGLRARGYNDIALYYLEQIEQDAGAPAEIRRIAPYERAMTLLRGTNLTRKPDERAAQLEEAAKLFEQFVQANPNDPRSADADSRRATIFLDRARVLVWQSQSPDSESRRDELQNQARDLIDRARGIYEAAHNKFKAEFDKFPVYIPDSERAQQEARRKAELGYITARIDLAKCMYERAQTFPPGSPDRQNSLKQAALEFEKIHEAYRSLAAGLIAYLWQGKCFEEMDEIGKALGIYNELLGHDAGSSPTLKSLQSQALQFRLICLNHPQRNDFQVVVQEASEWLNDRSNAGELRTRAGLGIRWERVRALEQLSLGRDIAPNDRNKLLNVALADAGFIRGIEGQYQEQAAHTAQRLELLLKGENARPRDFDTAIVLANSHIRRLAELDKRHRAAREADERNRIRQELDAELPPATEMFHLALGLAREGTDLRQVNLVRVWLAHAELLAGRTLDAAVIGEFVARKYAKAQSETALDAAWLTLGAYQQAYRNAPADDRTFELERMIAVGDFIVSTWPSSDRANDVRFELGRLQMQRGEPLEAARWFASVPESARTWAAAQTEAGRAWWRAYQLAIARPEAERPPADELEKWREEAEKHLRAGIAQQEERIAAGGAIPPEFIDARFNLAQVAVYQGKYAEAVKLLTEDPGAPLTAIEVAEDEARPATGIQSRNYAAAVYQQLLRAYVGDGRLDDALRAMDSLERIGGEDNIAIYVRLGQEQQKEIERLGSAGEKTRLAEVLASFDDFLSRLYERREGQNYASMIWIAETYFGLGEGLASDRTAAAGYFDKAATMYEAILNRARQEGEDFVEADRLPGVRLRLVNCRRRQGDYQKAFDLAVGVLAERPNVLSAQIEAASVLEDWGASGQADSPEKYLQAIQGMRVDSNQTKVHVWGWVTIANRIKQAVDQAGAADPEMEDQHLEARYHISSARHRYGLTRSGADRQKELERAQAEIVALSRIRGDMEPEWWDRFDALYRQVQTDLGVADPKPLERPQLSVARSAAPQPEAAPETTTAAAPQERAAGAPAAETTPPAEEGGSTALIGLVALLLAGAATAWVVYAMGGAKRRRRRTYASSSPASYGTRTGTQSAARKGSDGARPTRPTSAKQ